MPSSPLTTPRPAVAGRRRDPGPRPLPRVPLGPAAPAHPLPRPPLGLLGRWLRRLERRLNLELGRWLYPYIPGMRLPYSRQLRRGLVVAQGQVPVPRLPPAFAGATVLLVTDIHTGPFLSVGALAETFQRLRALEPDLILLGGDLTTGTVEEFRPFMPAFAALQAPLGVFAVMGNHDYYSGDPGGLRRLIAATGVQLLDNRSVPLRRGEAAITLAGIDDLHYGRPDLPAALGAGEPPHLLLSHNPDVFFDAAWRGVGLVLAGHTHGGQICPPGFPLVIKMSRYALDHGRFSSDGSHLVVSRGMGVTGLPLRWRCPPEAVLVTLQTSQEPTC